MRNTLVLAPDFQPVSFLPLSAIDWQTAVKLFFLNKVQVLEWYDDWTIHSAKLEMRVPAVVVTCSSFSRQKRGVMRFNRHNLFLRDLFTCQYCGDTQSGKNLTIDHVVPLSKGGKTAWENCVTACKECNHRKGNSYWRPNREPASPDYWKLVNSVKQTATRVHHPSWKTYLGLEAENIEVESKSA